MMLRYHGSTTLHRVNKSRHCKSHAAILGHEIFSGNAKIILHPCFIGNAMNHASFDISWKILASSLHFSLCQRVRPAADRIERVSDGGNVAGQRQLVGKKKAGAWKPEEVGLRLTILLNNIVKSYYCVLEEINKKWGQTLTFWWKLDEDRLRQSAYWTNIIGIL